MKPEERREFWSCFWPYDFKTDAQRMQEEAGLEPIRKVTPREREHHETFRGQVTEFLEWYGEGDYESPAFDRFFDEVVELLRRCAWCHEQNVLPPSKANRERLAVLDKLLGISDTLKAHIHDMQWELYDQHPDPVIQQLITILSQPIEDSHSIDAKKFFLREVVHLCRRWRIPIEIEESYGFYRLIELLKHELNISLDHRKRWDEIQQLKRRFS
jgi:hypothetical protein